MTYNQEPLTPETDRRPLSPSTSHTPSEINWTFSHPQQHQPVSHTGFEIEEEIQHETLSPEKAQPHEPMFLSRSRGVQTDGWPRTLVPFSLPSHLLSTSPHDARSESSSLTDSQPSNMTFLVERVVALLNRMTQADTLTLTNRLKRQNLKGADLGHLSRVTVGGIVSDAGNLRTQFRAFLEDDKQFMACTHKDLRGLFKVFKDSFVEMGHMRVTLNDVILDPSVAGKLSELALNPSKAEVTTPTPPTSSGWMAPISKLFGSSSGEGTGATRDIPTLNPDEVRGRAKSRPRHRVIPKLGPALSASTTTVNVEFSGSGVGRAVTSTIKAPGETTVSLPAPVSNGSSYRAPTIVMGIFAGAPGSSTPDPWVILNKPLRSVHAQPNMLNPPPLARANSRNDTNLNGMSRNVDAVIDVSSSNDTGSDTLGPLLQRTLRRRGLSDSSIHSTFLAQAEDSRLPPHAVMRDRPSRENLSDRVSVLKALSKTVQNFRLTTSGSQPVVTTNHSSEISASPQHSSISSEDAVHSTSNPPPNLRATSPLAALLPNISSWAGANASPEGAFYIGSVREDSLLHQARGYGGHGRDYC